jgi:hypothetical protein
MAVGAAVAVDVGAGRAKVAEDTTVGNTVASRVAIREGALVGVCGVPLTGAVPPAGVKMSRVSIVGAARSQALSSTMNPSRSTAANCLRAGTVKLFLNASLRIWDNE